MKIGINLLLWTAAADENHFSVLDDVKRWGYDGFELPMFDPACSPWKKIAAHADGLGLGRTAVTIMSNEANPVSPDAAVRRKGLEHLERCIDACVELGADTLVGPMYSPCGGLVGRGRTEDEFNWACDVLEQAADYAAKADLVLAMEPLNRFETYVFNSLEDGLRMVEQAGRSNLGLLFDTFHANLEEKDPAASIRKAGGRIVHVHISENDRSTPGSGQIHWKPVFDALKAIGYDRWLTIEAFGRSMPEVAAATCIWRSMFESEEQLATDGLKHIQDSWRTA
ncbi:MAG: TIM barrel protein [bacterium]|nr:TIM barrel protein [bacterium]